MMVAMVTTSMAQTLEFTFNKVSASEATVTVTGNEVEAGGITATIASNQPWKALKANSQTFPNASIVCPDKNTNTMTAGNEGTITLTLNNVPEGYSFKNVTFTSVALNGGGEFQGDDANAQHVNFTLTKGETTLGVAENVKIKVNSNGGESVVLPFEVAEAYTAENGTLELKLTLSITESMGCFYGLIKVAIDTEVAAVEPEPEPEPEPTNMIAIYQITAKDAARGALYATAESTHLTHCGATYGNYHNRDIAVDAKDVNQQFAFIEYEGNLYLYSLGAQKFASKDGQFVELSAIPKGFVTVVDSDVEGYKLILFNGENRLNFSGGYTHGVVANYETPDDGNRLMFTKVGTFDPTELIAEVTAKIKEEAEALAAARAAFDAKYAEAEAILAEAELSVTENELPLQVADANAAAYVWCNNPDPGEGPIAQLVDGIAQDDNFFHTSWRGGGEEPHYIEIDLGEGNELDAFSFKYTTRFAVQNDYPDGIQVLGSNDKEAYTELYNVTSGLPQTGGTEWTSNIVSSETAYRYLRFVVTAERTYWHMSEFDIFTTEVSVDQKYAAVANTVVALDNAFKAAADNAEYTKEELYAAVEALNAAIEAINAGVVVAEPLVPTKATRNPAESALSPDNMYKLAGVKLDFAENIKKAEGVTVWGKIVDANGNEVAVLDKIMGGTSWFATPYTSTPVTVAGTYKVVVNAGVFTSADGSKVYQGGEYEFTVQGQPVTMIPAADEGFFYGETFTTVEEFLTLSIRIKGAAEVALTGEAQITMTQGENEYVAELTITEEDGDKLINIAFPADAEYAEGSYTVNVPAGVFTINGTANEAFASSSFTYSTPKLKITKDWTSWEALFTAKYMMPREVAITINNADEVTVAEGLVATLAVGETTYNSTVEFTNEGNNYWISFHFAEIEAIYEDENADFIKGEYTFTVPADLYTVNGEANVEETKTFTYGDAVVAEFSVKSITPAPGTVQSLDQIAISFTNTTKPDQLIVTNEAGDKFSFISKNGAYVAVDPNYAEAPITEAGKYTLDLSELEGLVGRNVFTWTVNPNAVMPTSYISTSEYVPYQLPGIKLVFDEKVTAADLAEGETSYGYILNAAGEKVLELNKKGYISGNMKYISFTNDNMDYVEGAGDYTVVITATITFESGNVYNGGEFVLTVTKQPAEVTLDVDLWGTLDTMPTTINITVDNVEVVALDETKKATLTFGETVYEAAATLNGNVITLVFPEDVEYANGSYTLVVPEGFFTCDGEASEEIWEQFTYKKPVPLKILSVTPAEGVVESIEKITIVFNQEIDAQWEFEMNGALFVRTDGWAASATIEYTASVYDMSIWDYAPSPVTAPGEYVLNIESVTEMALAEGEKATYTWTIAEAETVVNYTPDFTGPKTRPANVGTRNITSVSLGENTYSLLTPEQSSCYVDATETVTFIVEAGATVKATVAYQGEWMHHAVFIDFDGDGFTSGLEEGSEWKPAGDLVAYSFYNNGGSSDEYGYNSVGTYMSGMDRHVPEIPEFAVPTTPGTYRIRFVQDWCSINPNGDKDGKFGDFMDNGGQIVDVTLVVTEPTGIENIENVEVKTIYDLTGRKIETITKAGIYIVNGKKVLVK